MSNTDSGREEQGGGTLQKRPQKDSQGRCVRCEGTGTWIDESGWPVDCPACNGVSEQDE